MYYFCTPRQSAYCVLTALAEFLWLSAFFTVIASAAKQSHEDCTGTIEYGATTREIAASPAPFSLSLRAQRSNLMRIAPALLNTAQQRGRLPRRLRLLAMTGKGRLLAMTEKGKLLAMTLQNHLKKIRKKIKKRVVICKKVYILSSVTSLDSCVFAHIEKAHKEWL